jgi:outer membrane protein TolC
MRKTSLLALLLMPLGLLTACKTVGPDFAAPASPPPRVGYASDGAGHAVLGEGPQPLWWTAFASPQLDALVDTALAHNHSLAASMATLERSRDHIRAISGRSKPQVDAKGRAEYEQFNLSQQRSWQLWQSQFRSLHPGCRCQLRSRPIRQEPAHARTGRGRS